MHHLLLTPTDGSAGLPLAIPARWDEVTLATYLEFRGSDESILAAITGLDMEAVGRLAADDVTYVANCLAFMADPAPLLELMPSSDLPEVGASPYGLLMLATQHVESLPEGTPGMVAAPYLYALYRCQQLYGKADDAKVEAMRVAVLGEPVTKVFADVAFFLKSWRRATAGTPPRPRTQLSPKKLNTKPVLKTFLSGLGLF